MNEQPLTSVVTTASDCLMYSLYPADELAMHVLTFIWLARHSRTSDTGSHGCNAIGRDAWGICRVPATSATTATATIRLSTTATAAAAVRAAAGAGTTSS